MSRLSRVIVLSVCTVSSVLLWSAVNGRPDDMVSKTGSTPTAEESNAAAPHEAIAEFDPAAPLKIARQANERIRTALQQRVTIHFADEPLDSAMKKLGEIVGVPVWIDELAFDEEGIEPTVPIQIDLHNVRLKTALVRILEPFGLDWFVGNEVLQISSQVVSDERLYLKMHNVQPLLSDPYGEQDLRDVIKEITTGLWQEHEGAAGAMYIRNGLLTILQTERVNEEVDLLLPVLLSNFESNRPVVIPLLPEPDDAAVYRKLGETVELDVEGVMLKHAVALLSQELNIPIGIDEVALDEEGISVEEEIDFKTPAVTLRSALNLNLEPFGLTTVVRLGRLEVTSQVVADEVLVVCVYGVGDLLDAGFDMSADLYEVSLRDLLFENTSGAWIENDGVGGNPAEFGNLLIVRQTQQVHAEIALLFGDLREQIASPTFAVKEPPEPVDPQTVQTKVYQGVCIPIEDLHTLIVDTVAPQSWQTRGGSGIIHKVGDVLVATTTVDVHKQIERFLENVRRQMFGLGGKKLGGGGGGFF